MRYSEVDGRPSGGPAGLLKQGRDILMTLSGSCYFSHAILLLYYFQVENYGA